MAAIDTAQPIRVPWTRGRIASWLVTTDHKRIGILYIATCLVFFVAGGIMARALTTASERRKLLAMIVLLSSEG